MPIERPIIDTIAVLRLLHNRSFRTESIIMDVLSISAMSVKRNTISSRGGGSRTGSGSGARLLPTSQYRMDESMPQTTEEAKPVVTKLKAARCYRPKDWSPEVEEAFRVQQVGWRDLKEYMETYGEPERWDNGFIRCTRVKSNGYYTYWRAHRECEDKYLHAVKMFEYA